MKKILFLILIAGIYQWYSSSNEVAKEYGKPHNELIMYSLTTCGYCKQKARQLKGENIAFTEYFIDKDKKRMTELNKKLTAAGFKPKSYGTPIFDVHGVMLPNNPKMSLIKEKLNNA
jgi:glutaredoxin